MATVGLMSNLLRCIAAWIGAILGFLITPIAFASQSELVQLRPRSDVVQAYLFIRENEPVKAVAVLVSGGFGLLKFRSTDSGIQYDESVADFLVRNKEKFLDREIAIAIIDVPSDQLSYGYTPKFRKSDAHAEDLKAVVKDLKQRAPGAKIFLIGNSQGSTSVAYAGKALGKEVDGVILTAAVFEWAPAAWRLLHDSNLSNFDFSVVPVPALIVHHADDRCVATPFSAAAKYEGKVPLMIVRGGDPVRDNGCGPMGPHGFLGKEDTVINEIKNWMHARPYQSEIR